MKNMKLNILVAGLLLTTGTQVFTTKTEITTSESQTNLDNAIHAYLTANKAHLTSLQAAKMTEVKKQLTELFNQASESEKEVYKEFMEYLTAFNPAQLMKELTTLKKIVAALKEVNDAAYTVIKTNLPRMIAAFV